jgi:16S rRNA processing protein RimM
MPQRIVNNAGSEEINEPAFLVLGKLRKAHGVYGEITMEIYTEMLELLDPGRIVLIGETHLAYTILTTRWKQDLLLVKFKNIQDRTQVSKLTNQLVFVKSSDLPPLSDEEVYYHQLIGLQVYDVENQYLGILKEILQTGANDVYIIQDGLGNEVLIPAVEDMILDINLEMKEMIVSKMVWYGEGE